MKRNEKELEYTCQVCRINKSRKWRRLSETASKKYNNENIKLEVGDCLCNSCYMTYISNPNNLNRNNKKYNKFFYSLPSKPLYNINK